MPTLTPVSVIICAYSDARREQLNQAIVSLLQQETSPAEIIVVIDHNPSLLQHVETSFPQIKTVPNSGARGLSGARNSGIRTARHDIIAFLDDDAIAEPDWLTSMVPHYADQLVVGVGGRVVPMWQAGRPRWFPEEFLWVVGCSYRGQPDAVRQVRNPIGCNMSFRRSVFDRVGGFREGIGRTGADAAGCEETELCIRAKQGIPGSRILYDPFMIVRHQVTPDRSRWRYFRVRCLAEGRSKTRVVDEVGVADGLASEQFYVTRTLPRGVVRHLGDVLLRRDAWGLARVGSIIGGLGFTTAGYVAARVAKVWKPA